MPVNHVSFSQGHSNDVSSGHIVPPGYGTDVVDWVGSKAANCNPQLLETRWGLERILKHSCGTVLPTNHVSIGKEHSNDVSSVLLEPPRYGTDVVD